MTDHVNGKIVVWHKNNPNHTHTLHVHVFEYSDLFVGLNGDVYFENGDETGRIEKWAIDQNSATYVVAKFDGHCFSLFIDWNNFLYCSQHEQHKVTKVSLNRENSPVIIVAGDGFAGSSPTQLHHPWGIFVDREFNLFVADAANNRIHSCRGETVAKNPIRLALTLSNRCDYDWTMICISPIITTIDRSLITQHGVGCPMARLPRRMN